MGVVHCHMCEYIEFCGGQLAGAHSNVHVLASLLATTTTTVPCVHVLASLLAAMHEFMCLPAAGNHSVCVLINIECPTFVLHKGSREAAIL